MSKKVLITGAVGMVGHYLVKKCVDRGYFVRATDIRYNDIFANICEGHQTQFEFVKPTQGIVENVLEEVFC